MFMVLSWLKVQQNWSQHFSNLWRHWVALDKLRYNDNSNWVQTLKSPVKSATWCNAAYMSQTRDQKRLAVQSGRWKLTGMS